MKRWWENMVLLAGVVTLVPVVLVGLAYGPWALLAVPLWGIAAVAIYLRLRRLRLHPEEAPPVVPRARRAPPLPPLDDETLAAVPVPVRACPDCGFLGIRMPTIGDGLWPGGGELGDRMVCPRCDWQGLPVRFDKREDYGDFLRALSAPAA